MSRDVQFYKKVQIMVHRVDHDPLTCARLWSWVSVACKSIPSNGFDSHQLEFVDSESDDLDDCGGG